MKRYELFSQVMAKISEGLKIKFTPKNVAPGDRFLIFNDDDDECEVTFHTNRVPYWLEFSNDEPMRLEDVPTSFLESILQNV